jgi:hypothetical protein
VFERRDLRRSRTTSTADDRALHGAACQGRLLIAETSCEARSLRLDRALLVETMSGQQSGFFSRP